MAFVVVALAGCTTLQQRISSGDTGWVLWKKSAGGNGHWYRAIACPKGITWTQADKLARGQNGYLATVTSAEENNFVFGLIKAPIFFTDNGTDRSAGAGPAIGGYQLDGAKEPDGSWCWVTGEAWNYTNWFPGQPNNYNLRQFSSEDRLKYHSGIRKTPASTWNDMYRDDTNVGGYVIERDK